MTEVLKEGALYELVARGNKDVYFQSDALTSVSPFRNNYKRVPAFVHELRSIPPINNTEFGKVIEFNFDVAGDIFFHPTLYIDLPSWLPSDAAAMNSNSIITDLNNVSYGYTQGIAYFLFSNIQIYQDQILLQEFSGDALYGSRLSRGSLSSSFLINTLVGLHDGSALSIGRNATLKGLRLELPLLGCQHIDDGGFPSFGVRSQNFRLRLTLRKLEDLVESSDGQSKPTPWGKQFKMTTQSSTTQFTCIDRFKLDSPTIYLESRHVYVDPDTQKDLVDTTLEYPFSRLYENTFFFNERDYAPLLRNAIAAASRRIDAVHPASRMIFYLRSKSDIDANKLWKITSDVSNNEYYNNVSFLIGSRDRETLFSSTVWNLVAQHAKEDRYSGPGLGVMNWDLGDQRDRILPCARVPEGSLNFSSADRPTLYIELQQIGGSDRNTQMLLIVDTWAIYEMDADYKRGVLRYAN